MVNKVTYIDDGLPDIIFADRSRLEHVIINLISNAVKFSPEGSSIYLDANFNLQSPQSSSWRRAISENSFNGEEANLITISVRDEGPGIAASDLSSLFQPYHQINPEASQRGQGSGLGNTN